MINFVYADNHIATAASFLEKINQAILFPLITLLTAVAVLVFLYGVFEYVMKSASEEGRTTGQRHILWGLVGLLVMLSAYTILGIAANTFNLGDELEKANNPSVGYFAPPAVVDPGGESGAEADPMDDEVASEYLYDGWSPEEKITYDEMIKPYLVDDIPDDELIEQYNTKKAGGDIVASELLFAIYNKDTAISPDEEGVYYQDYNDLCDAVPGSNRIGMDLGYGVGQVSVCVR